MKNFKFVRSIITPLDKINVDTDQIVPKQFLKLVTKTGFGKYLFYNWRFNLHGGKKPNFVLNKSLYRNSKILVSRDNFGCGSSREHAVWAIIDYGFEVVIATSFADIFYDNCFQNGLLPIQLNGEIINKLMKFESYVKVNLPQQIIEFGSERVKFVIDVEKKQNLMSGLDNIALTMKYEDKISEYENISNVPSIL